MKRDLTVEYVELFHDRGNKIRNKLKHSIKKKKNTQTFQSAVRYTHLFYAELINAYPTLLMHSYLRTQTSERACVLLTVVKSLLTDKTVCRGKEIEEVGKE